MAVCCHQYLSGVECFRRANKWITRWLAWFYEIKVGDVVFRFGVHIWSFCRKCQARWLYVWRCGGTDLRANQNRLETDREWLTGLGLSIIGVWTVVPNEFGSAAQSLQDDATLQLCCSATLLPRFQSKRSSSVG